MGKLEEIQCAEDVPPTSLDLIGEFERKLKITFPDDYKAFALKNAGGEPRSFSDFDFVLDGLPFYAAVGIFLAFQAWGDLPETETMQWVQEHVEGASWPVHAHYVRRRKRFCRLRFQGRAAQNRLLDVWHGRARCHCRHFQGFPGHAA